MSGAPGPESAPALTKPAKKSPAAGGHNEVAHIGNLWGYTSDKPGQDAEQKAKNGEAGKPGNRGFNAGRIEIYCDRLANPLDLELLAIRGRGANGQDGQQGQDGQDGGRGNSLREHGGSDDHDRPRLSARRDHQRRRLQGECSARGVHEFVRRDGKVVVLTSSSVRRSFSYEYIQQENRSILNIKQDGTVTDTKERMARYAPLSPFTWWRIELDPILNKGLDVSNLTAVEMEFHGSSYPFS